MSNLVYKLQQRTLEKTKVLEIISNNQKFTVYTVNKLDKLVSLLEVQENESDRIFTFTSHMRKFNGNTITVIYKCNMYKMKFIRCNCCVEHSSTKNNDESRVDSFVLKGEHTKECVTARFDPRGLEITNELKDSFNEFLTSNKIRISGSNKNETTQITQKPKIEFSSIPDLFNFNDSTKYSIDISICYPEAVHTSEFVDIYFNFRLGPNELLQFDAIPKLPDSFFLTMNEKKITFVSAVFITTSQIQTFKECIKNSEDDPELSLQNWFLHLKNLHTNNLENFKKIENRCQFLATFCCPRCIKNGYADIKVTMINTIDKQKVSESNIFSNILNYLGDNQKPILNFSFGK